MVRIDLATGVATLIDALEIPFGVAAVLPICADGLDNDGDGTWDASGATADPGCESPAWTLDNPQCDNDLDDDGDGRIDWNGPGTPDPQCAGQPWRNRERGSCGLGAELALLLGLIAARRRSQRNVR